MAGSPLLIIFGQAISNDILLAVCLGLFGLFLCLYLSMNNTKIDLSNYRDDAMSKKSKISDVIRDNLWIESPLIKSEWLSNFLGNNCNVTLKLDSLQPCGTFKIRGISSFMKQKFLLNKNIDTFITTSASNAGIAVAYCSNKLNCKCLLILDESYKNDNDNKNNIKKIQEEYEFIEIQYYGKTWNECDEYAVKLGEHESGKYCYVPIFDDPAIFDGHSSIIRELSEQYLNGDGGNDDNYPDCIICSVGGGGLLTGIIGGLFQVGWSRQCKIIAAQSEHCSLLQAGINNSFEPIPIRAISCTGKELGHKSICKKALDFSLKLNSFNPLKSIIVKDLDVLNCCTLFAKKHHILLEPLCGVAITALYKNKQYFKQFNNICIIVCGGNDIYYNKQLLNNSLERGLFDDKTTKFDIMDAHNLYQQKTTKKQEIIDTIYDKEDQKDNTDDDNVYNDDLLYEDIDHYDSQSEEM